jgi:hypothetical protein
MTLEIMAILTAKFAKKKSKEQESTAQLKIGMIPGFEV